MIAHLTTATHKSNKALLHTGTNNQLEQQLGVAKQVLMKLNKEKELKNVFVLKGKNAFCKCCELELSVISNRGGTPANRLLSHVRGEKHIKLSTKKKLPIKTQSVTNYFCSESSELLKNDHVTGSRESHDI